MRLVANFPLRSGHADGPTPKKPDYHRIRERTVQLLRCGHIARILAATYDRLLVDEYQDCSVRQHRMVMFTARSLPTIVLGDPLQAIFSFDQRDPLADWSEDVCQFFPLAGELNQPWRWLNADNDELGAWLTSVRASLMRGQSVCLSSAPDCVRWIRLRGDNSDHATRLKAARCPHRKPSQTALVIGDSKSEDSRHRIAKSVPGIVTVEPVDLRSLTDFAARLERCDGDGLSVTLSFASKLMTNVRTKEVLGRVRVLKDGRARKPPDDVEKAALHLTDFQSPETIANLLDACSRRKDTRVYRPELLRACQQALKISRSGPHCTSFSEAAIRVREERRAVGRRLPLVGIGSTLLLKGLEADHAVILDSVNLDSNNLYVALTRGSSTVTVCSPAAEIAPLTSSRPTQRPVRAGD